LRKLLLALVPSVLFLALFFYLIPAEELLSDLKKIKPEGLLYGFTLYTLSQLLRSVRWSILLGLPLLDAFFLNAVNLFLNNVLPARSGELSWFYYAHRLGIPLKNSVFSFFIGRLYDLFALLCVVPFSYLLLKSKTLSLLFLLFLFPLSLLPRYVYVLVPPVRKLREVRAFMSENLSIRLSLYLFWLSFLSFLLKALSTYAVVQTITDMDLFTYSLGFLGGELSSVLPIHSFMGYGTYEGGFILALSLAGVETKGALKVAFLAHNFLLLSSALLGTLAILYLHTRARKSP